MRHFLLLSVGLLLCPALGAQTFQAQVDSSASTSVFALDSELENSGTLQGDFDPDTNPGGTQTRLGLFGGSGNMPIPITLDLLSAAGGASGPEGVFALALDLPALTGTLSELSLDLAPDAAYPTDVSARLVYQTFRTVNPDCTFPSVGPVTQPIGEIGQIRDISLQQIEAAPLQLKTTPDPERYSFETTVPARLSLIVDTEFADEPLPLDDLPVSLPLSGILERSGPDRFELQAALAPQSIEGSLDLDGTELPPIPLPLPCVLPPGEEASLIMNLSANALVYALQLGLEITAEAIDQTPVDPIFADAFEQP